MTTAVRFEGVGKRFGDVEVLREVDLAIAAERTTAIIGESGSGKSTLLQMINGLVQPDEGAVEVFDDVVGPETLLRIRRRTGYAVQGSALFPHLTVRENVTLLASLEGWDARRREARLAALMELMELAPELVERYPHELSGGQQQRASLCRAMMLEPPLLLLDEPFSAVDPITRMGIHDHFRRLAATESKNRSPREFFVAPSDGRLAHDLANRNDEIPTILAAAPAYLPSGAW